MHVAMKPPMPAAALLLPPLRPIEHHSSLTRRHGGFLPPATVAKMTASSVVRGSPHAAASTVRHVDHDADSSPKADASNLLSLSARLMGMEFKARASHDHRHDAERERDLQRRWCGFRRCRYS